ncbi:hypothetical protein O3G_MSEX005232 [Manduca sexta]|uniref:Uncharacterized protein n=1 Tax=Manduca sexta TaxID=7130 RepID=A0A922CIZ5_MANSE|nr:hypothetical protein O3G_MSEX005232 [Manduca sexta]
MDGHDTWLDIILTSAPSPVFSHGKFSAPGFFHHDLIYMSYALKPPKFPSKIFHLRSFGRIDADKLKGDAANVNLDHLLAATSVDDKVAIFNRAVTSLFDTHAPLKKIKLKRPPAPWITNGVRMAMRRWDRAFRQYRSYRSEENWCLFKAKRNRCNQMVRNAKCRHILSNISSFSSASIWRLLGTLGIGKVKNIDLHGATIGLDDINKHFTSVTMIDHQTRRRTMDFLAGLSRPNINTFHFLLCHWVKLEKSSCPLNPVPLAVTTSVVA